MTFNLLKIQTSTCTAYFQTNDEDDRAVCVLSTNHIEYPPGKVVEWQILFVRHNAGGANNIDMIEEIK